MTRAQQLARAARTVRAASARRDALIVELLEGGMALRAVAALAGVSHATVANVRDRHHHDHPAVP